MNYELTDETKIIDGHTLHRIRAVRDLPHQSIKAGNLGGWIESVDNLIGDAWVYGNARVSGDAKVYGNAKVSGDAWVYGNAKVSGDAWVYGNARVSGDAKVSGNAKVYGDAKVSGNAKVYGNAWVYGNAKVCGDARVHGDAKVSGNAWVYGNAEVKSSIDYCVYKNTWSSFRWFTYTKSNKMWKVGCFYGTGEELIAKAYKDSELSGKCYEAIVRAKEAIYKAIEEEEKHKK